MLRQLLLLIPLSSSLWSMDPEEIILEEAKGAPAILINQEDTQGRISLHHAASQGDVEQCNLLIAQKATFNKKDTTGMMPLHNAAGNGHANVCELLLANGADRNPKEKLLILKLKTFSQSER